MNEPPILAVVERGGRAESVHRGTIVVATERRTVFEAGDGGVPVFPRSALKPFQALSLLEDGVDRELALTPREIALTAASHSGDESHVDVARSLLAKGGCSESDLRCGTHPPMDSEAAERLARAGAAPTPLHHNCSGKHASMLIQARRLGAPLESYLDPGHPVQRRIVRLLAAMGGVDEAEIAIAVDGCSAPALALPLRALAVGLARLAAARTGATARDEACRRLFDACLAEPHFLSGRRRFDLAVMKAGRGRVLSKGGMEGVLTLAIRPPSAALEGVGVAIKIEDGDARGYYPAALAILRWLGFDPPAAPEELSSAVDPILRNHRGQEVGRVRLGDTLARLPPPPWPR